MGGGLMQLVAYGAQDIYLTGNPQITFFKVVYRRHTNFSMEAIKQTIQGNINFGNRVSISLSRNGDLISNMWLDCSCKDNSKKGYEGLSIINKVDLEIGGQLIDRQTYRYMHGYLRTFYSEDKLQNISTMSEILPHENSKFIIPLLFWFCKDPGLALPLIALQYHEVKVFLDINNGLYPLKDHEYESGIKLDDIDIKFWVNYIYLDTDERRRFAQVSHEYLIEQVQVIEEPLSTCGSTPISRNINLHFNHPVKYLMWYIGESSDNINSNKCINNSVVLKDAIIRLNGHDRFKKQEFDYFANYQYYQHGLGNRIQNNSKLIDSPPNYIKYDAFGNELYKDLDNSDISQSYRYILQKKINCHEGLDQLAKYKEDTQINAVFEKGGGVLYYLYSFSLKPKEHQPSGTCNFSRIDNAELSISYKSTLYKRMHLDSDGLNYKVKTPLELNDTPTIHIFAVNYNVLRIMSGMGGLAYSN